MERLVNETEAGALGPVYSEIRLSLGVATVPLIFQAMAGIGADVLLQNWTAYRRTFLSGRLPRLTKEWIGLALGVHLGSPYLTRWHALHLQALGAPLPEVRAVTSSGALTQVPDGMRPYVEQALLIERTDGAAYRTAEEAFGEEVGSELVDLVLMVRALGRFATEAGLAPESIAYLFATGGTEA
ncbi:MAG TPA: hypothetical protein VK191_05430 [Symbiobacteriaceae bacterium]|nr:hypothetical protein [Symbiobacteriaceae bacterium]